MSGAPGEECLVFAVLARSHLKNRFNHGNTRKHTEIHEPNRSGSVLFYSSVSFHVIPYDAVANIETDSSNCPQGAG